MGPLFLLNLKNLFKEKNSEKKRHPYKTSSAFITLLAKMWVVYDATFRSLGAIARILSRITVIETCTVFPISGQNRELIMRRKIHNYIYRREFVCFDAL